MSFKLTAAVVITVWSVGVMQVARAEQTPGATSIWKGVYTTAQAKLGQASYAKHCAECHGEDLAGDGFAPGLKGPEFMNNWNGLTVAELFDRIKVSMPPTNPNSVSVKDKTDIVAYILMEDGFPAGTTELPSTMEGLKALKFEATKPGN